MNDMNLRDKLKNSLLFLSFAGALVSCNTDIENMEIQKPYTYDDKYYENLREYKKSNHQISYMWFADYTTSLSLGTRFLGLPDSLDICSLWSGMPAKGSAAYEEMRFVQKVKGTKVIFCTFPTVENKPEIMELPEDQWVKALGDQILNTIYQNDLDGVDMDYELKTDWMGKDGHMTELIEYLGQYIGPKGKDPEKLLIVDVTIGKQIPGGYEYLNYLVSQAYEATKAEELQTYYNYVSTQLDSKRFIVTTNMGDFYQTGGLAFTEYNGNTTSAYGGRLYSLEGMARWNPLEGPKGGFGAFYGQRDYNNNPSYKYFRQAIQQQNPAVQ